MIRITVTNAWRTEFVYDGFQRLRIRREYTWTGSSWGTAVQTRYLYDGRRVIQERNGSNTPLVSYTRGLDISGSLEGAGGIGGLLMRSEHAAASPDSYYHADGSGNITLLMTTAGAVGARYLYDPFGNILAQSGSLADANVYQFSSKEYHGRSGLVYYGYRFYEPGLQRWLNRDPINELGFKLLTRSRNEFNLNEEKNVYAFVGNEPVNRFDPDGRKKKGPITILIGFLSGCDKGAKDPAFRD